MNRFAQAIYESLTECLVIDTHEHLDNECRQPKWNVMSDYTRHYFVCDLISAGMPASRVEMLADQDLSIREKWAHVEPYWDYCRHTGYGRMLDLSAKALYGVDEINSETIEAVEKGYQTLRAEPGYGERILRETCRIERVMNNIGRLNGDDLNGLFWFVTQFDNWVMFDSEALGVKAKLDSMRDIDEWVDLAIQTLGDDYALRGAKALKMGIAYRRTLYFGEATHEKAQSAFENRFGGTELAKDAQDYLLHAILCWADEKRLIVQIHTGYQEGNGHMIGHTNPEHLNNLVMKYSNIRFDLFHMGFPYQNFSCALGKMFPNVRLNFCWSHILSPLMMKNALKEGLSTVPFNKFFAFGGDCLFYDGVVGHLIIAKQNVAEALGELVEDGLMPIKRATSIARMLFYDNPKSFYGMS